MCKQKLGLGLGKIARRPQSVEAEVRSPASKIMVMVRRSLRLEIVSMMATEWKGGLMRLSSSLHSGDCELLQTARFPPVEQGE